MKYIKKFENVNTTPKVGDYLLFDPGDSVCDEYRDFYRNTPGIVYNVFMFNDKNRNYVVLLYDNPSNSQKRALSYNTFLGYFTDTIFSNIIFYGTKKDIEIYLDAKKYNL